jgi:hypothetical protein
LRSIPQNAILDKRFNGKNVKSPQINQILYKFQSKHHHHANVGEDVTDNIKIQCVVSAQISLGMDPTTELESSSNHVSVIIAPILLGMDHCLLKYFSHSKRA